MKISSPQITRISQIHQDLLLNFFLYFFKCEASLRAERTDSAMVATKKTIEYRFHSRLHSAQRMQDKFFRLAVARRSGKAERILVAAVEDKRVRERKRRAAQRNKGSDIKILKDFGLDFLGFLREANHKKVKG